jgi:hypothetical protein
MRRTGFSWLMLESSGGLLWTRWWTFGFHKKAGCFLTNWVTISFSNNIHYDHGMWGNLVVTRIKEKFVFCFDFCQFATLVICTAMTWNSLEVQRTTINDETDRNVTYSNDSFAKLPISRLVTVRFLKSYCWLHYGHPWFYVSSSLFANADNLTIAAALETASRALLSSYWRPGFYTSFHNYAVRYNWNTRGIWKGLASLLN